MTKRGLNNVTFILSDIFPAFEQQLKDEDEPNTTLHGLFHDFLYFVGKHNDQFTKKEIQKLAEFINEAVKEDDDLENAIFTCFLEHLYQVDAVKTIKPLLSKSAKDKMHA